MAIIQPPVNPDRRSLPEGWISRYDENYRAWCVRTHSLAVTALSYPLSVG
ncbi:hypothetical protein B0F90DRAFT_1727103 [Multifurca ochricompacta]|uniref:Uncharacterized protein n=1 Tax=Multifurca ochricompacta TaxID=376703 RepID=A0AAD4M2S5_9AGAM|nr:hypothetical protein B0F90DRAFT_1727103 [Multifurca ochricompacta]